MEGVYTLPQYEEALKRTSMITFKDKPPRARVFVQADENGTGTVTTICSADDTHKPAIPNLGVLYQCNRARSEIVKYVDVTDPDKPAMHEMLQETVPFTYTRYVDPPGMLPTGVFNGFALIIFRADIQNPDYIRVQFESLHGAAIDRDDVPQQLGFWNLDPQHPSLLVAITQPTRFEVGHVPPNLPKYYEWSMPLHKPRLKVPAKQPTARRGRRPGKKAQKADAPAVVKPKAIKPAAASTPPPLPQAPKSVAKPAARVVNTDSDEEDEDNDAEDDDSKQFTFHDSDQEIVL